MCGSAFAAYEPGSRKARAAALSLPPRNCPTSKANSAPPHAAGNPAVSLGVEGAKSRVQGHGDSGLMQRVASQRSARGAVGRVSRRSAQVTVMLLLFAVPA